MKLYKTIPIFLSVFFGMAIFSIAATIWEENFYKFDESIFSDEVDLSKYKFNISPRKNILNIKNKSIEFINNFDNPDYKNLLFVGSTGLR